MAAELSNPASERLIAGFAQLSQEGLVGMDLPSQLTDDFHYDDRRRLSLNGRLDGAEEISAFIAASWQTGAGSPQWDVHTALAVRGDRFAVCRFQLDYGNEMGNEGLFLIGVDPTLTRTQVLIEFDSDDADGAIAELDRLHREAEEG